MTGLNLCCCPPRSCCAEPWQHSGGWGSLRAGVPLALGTVSDCLLQVCPCLSGLPPYLLKIERWRILDQTEKKSRMASAGRDSGPHQDAQSQNPYLEKLERSSTSAQAPQGARSPQGRLAAMYPPSLANTEQQGVRGAIHFLPQSTSAAPPAAAGTGVGAHTDTH